MEEPTLQAIQYLVAECNYGGRITDTHDRRLLVTLLARLANLESASKENYDLSEVRGLYPVPSILDRREIVEDVSLTMRVVPHPQGMGLSDNSAMVRDQRDSKKLLRGVLLTQPGIADEVKSLFHFLLIKNVSKSDPSSQSCFGLDQSLFLSGEKNNLGVFKKKQVYG